MTTNATTLTMKTTTSQVARMAAFVAGVSLVASSFVAFAPTARAATVAELQAQVQALLAQIASLTTGSGASVTFTRDLTLGSSGAEVTALQNFLIKKGHSIPAGATGYFGVQTQTALKAFQAANGIAPAAGYFGPLTRARVNAMGGPVTTPSTPGSSLSGGEASLEDLKAQDGADDQVEEGSTAEVADFEFDVEDGDVRIERLDLTFDAANGNDEDEPWKAFETVRILDENGDEIAEENVSDEKDWLDNDGPYVFRFTGLNYVIREGDTGKLTVEVEAQNGVLDSGNTDSWTLFIDEDGLRGIDGAGLDQYLGDDSETVTFDLVEEGDGEELRVRTSTDDPDASTLQVNDDKRSEWYTIFAFELEAKDNDIELDQLPITLTTDTDNVQNVLDDAELVIDGKTFGDYTLTNGNSTTGTLTFDIDGDATIDEGDRAEVELRVRFKSANGTNYDAGETVEASVTGSAIEAEGADDLTATGNASGDTHTLQVRGIDGTRANRSAVTTVVDGSDDYATYTMQVEVTAFDGDVYIPTIGADAFTYQIENASNGAIVSGATATSSTVSSSARTSGNYYVVRDGDSETFTFMVVFNPLDADEPGNFRMQLLSIEYNTTAAAPNNSWLANPSSMYETQSTYIAD